MKILIIDNNRDPDCWGSEDLRRCVRLASDATLITRRAPEDDLPKNPSDFDRIIVSGSKTSGADEEPWVNHLIEFTQAAIAAKKPFLGVCFGHQILARSMGGIQILRKANSPEFGWSKINILSPSELFKGLKNSFYSFSAHYEEVSQLPSGMKRLAESDLCSIQACQLENYPVFGIQFHPEKNETDAEKIFQDKRLVKKGIPPTPLLHAGESKRLYDPQVSEIIFNNFFKL